MKGINHITKKDANIFAELGVEDAENLRVRAHLMVEIRRFVEDNSLTQTKAAQLMGTTQPRLNDVLNGRLEKCTIDRLVNMLASAGKHIRLEVDNAA